VIVFYISFGLKVTLVYALVAFTASLFAGFTLEKLGFEKYIKKIDEDIISQTNTFSLKKQQTSCCSPKVQNISFSKTINSTQEEKSTFKETLKEKVFNKDIVFKTWKQFLSFVPYIAIGIAIGAFVHGFVPSDIIMKYAGNDNMLAVPFSAIMGVPLYIRASTMVGIAPELIQSGVNMGSILALTIAGAGASLPEMIMLKRIFKLPIMIAFVFAVFTMAIVCGYLVNFYFI